MKPNKVKKIFKQKKKCTLLQKKKKKRKLKMGGENISLRKRISEHLEFSNEGI